MMEQTNEERRLKNVELEYSLKKANDIIKHIRKPPQLWPQ